jgi:hypothetical protein
MLFCPLFAWKKYFIEAIFYKYNKGLSRDILPGDNPDLICPSRDHSPNLKATAETASFTKGRTLNALTRFRSYLNFETICCKQFFIIYTKAVKNRCDGELHSNNNTVTLFFQKSAFDTTEKQNSLSHDLNDEFRHFCCTFFHCRQFLLTELFTVIQ